MQARGRESDKIIIHRKPENRKKVILSCELCKIVLKNGRTEKSLALPFQRIHPLQKYVFMPSPNTGMAKKLNEIRTRIISCEKRVSATTMWVNLV